MDLIHIGDRQLPAWIVSGKTLRDCLINDVEPFTVPRDRYFYDLLSHFVTNPLHKEKLIEWQTPEGQEDLYDYCYRPRRTALEILLDFQPLCVPVSYLYDLFPVMKEREFSIASSSVYTPSRVAITMGIVRYRTKLKQERIGVGTQWLASLVGQTGKLSYILL